VTVHVIAPLIGLVLGFVASVLLNFFFAPQRATKVDKHFRKLQLVSAALYSLGHGGNDAQKTMGIIAVLLFLARLYRRHLPRPGLRHVSSATPPSRWGRCSAGGGSSGRWG